METTTDQLIAEVEDGIGWLTFNHPERRNALTMAMTAGLPDILEQFAADDAVRVLAMKGAGDRAFVSGADISEFEQRRSSPESIAKFDAAGARMAASFAEFPKPIVAMIRGFAMGGGLMMAMRADIRIAAEDSQFGIPAARLGLGYGYQGVENLVALVGPAYASDILLTGGRFDAPTALRMGLVNRVVSIEDLEAETRAVAGAIAENAPLTIAALRASIREALTDPARRDVDTIAEMVAACFASADYIEGRRAFMEKRRPQFTGR